MRALDTLGVTTDKCAAMLYPLVESCIPAELLRAWQRTTSTRTSDGEITTKRRLDDLMTFLRTEVEGEERINIAVSGFGLGSDSRKTSKKKYYVESEENIPSAVGLLNNSSTTKLMCCVFCDGNHFSASCFKAKKMSLEDKHNLLSNKKCCFLCFKFGHISRRCKANIKCAACGKRHSLVMCTELRVNSDSTKRTEATEKSEQVQQPTVECTLANNTTTNVFLQTLVVLLKGVDNKRPVRVLIDTGSQKSYILQSAVLEMGYKAKRNDSVIHSMFGGVQSDVQNHACY